MNYEANLTLTSALALVDIFTSEIVFRTPKILRSDVLWLPHEILYARRQ